uniref:Uncharacterized protein n=1 Tax=Anguilla anguilla TaxID=7936 RepID=A0A0E9SR55_ANGAN
MQSLCSILTGLYSLLRPRWVANRAQLAQVRIKT